MSPTASSARRGSTDFARSRPGAPGVKAASVHPAAMTVAAPASAEANEVELSQAFAAEAELGPEAEEAQHSPSADSSGARSSGAAELADLEQQQKGQGGVNGAELASPAASEAEGPAAAASPGVPTSGLDLLGGAEGAELIAGANEPAAASAGSGRQQEQAHTAAAAFLEQAAAVEVEEGDRKSVV